MDMDDTDFLEGSFNYNFDCVRQKQNQSAKNDNYDILEKKLEYCELNSSHHHSNSELDIDENLTLKNNFKYYTTRDFHKLLKRKEISNAENCFSVLHTNISSLECSFSKSRLELHTLDHNFKVIVVTETWDSVHKEHLFASKILLGYHQYEGMTGKALKIGCDFFIANDLSYFVRRNISKSFYSVSSEFQALWIEIINKKGPNFVIYTKYIDIPEAMAKNFFRYLSESFTKLQREKKVVIVAGDFNFNLLHHETNKEVVKFFTLMLSNVYQLLQPTHSADHYKHSLIDNIFINSIEFGTIIGNLISKISDHIYAKIQTRSYKAI